jgi:signal transduction histidine kinase
MAIQRHMAEAESLRKRKEAENEAHQQMEILYQEAQESNLLKEEFIATLSHELRTPMTAILGWAELLVKNECPPEDFPMAFSVIHRNAITQNKLINDLLDFSRIITGKLKIENQQVNLEEVVRAAVDSIGFSLRAKKIDFHLSVDPSAGPVAGDAHRLQEVVWNLLSNAVKFTPQGGQISTRIQRHGSKIKLIVQDTGEGIDAEFLPHMFERFRQADGSLTRQHGGLGLGLTIAQHLVELHGGQIEAASLGKNKGAQLIVTLPMTAVRLPVTSAPLSPLTSPIPENAFLQGGQNGSATQ